jgi:hypothetical protein
MMSNRNSIIFLLLAIAAISSACNGSKQAAAEEGPSVWMETDPIQCLGNPWEEDWLSKQGREYGDYPIGNPRIVEKEEMEIIMDYFKGKGVTVYEVSSKPYPEDMAVCDACTCPAGYTLYLRVPEKQSSILEDFRFTQSDKP